MKILVLNGSPKGENSGTLYTSLYLEKLHPEHEFRYLAVGQKIRYFEADFSQPREILEWAELIVFSYPVYTFIAPYQVHRFVELMKEHKVELHGKWATQITTSKHFYDVTAHKFIEENCCDMGLNYVPGLSADMEDLLSEKGQLEARSFFEQTMFYIAHGISAKPKMVANQKNRAVISESEKSSKGQEATSGKKLTIVTCCSEDDVVLQSMIDCFIATSNATVKVCNVR